MSNFFEIDFVLRAKEWHFNLSLETENVVTFYLLVFITNIRIQKYLVIMSYYNLKNFKYVLYFMDSPKWNNLFIKDIVLVW